MDASVGRSVLLLPFRRFAGLALFAVQSLFVIWFLWVAYDIRMYPARDFGMIIHEFDPWFNYRAAEYLATNGFEKFFKWYDYMSWYPIGRPIGTTIYPGMQITAYGIREAMLRVEPFTYEVPNSPPVAMLRALTDWMRAHGFPASMPTIPETIAYAPMSVNDICCMIPPWFGAIASLFTGLLTFEVTRSTNAAVVATGVMAVIPAHLMRSVAGEFDNEAVAMAAITCTFWLWLRSVRTPRSWLWGIPAGLSYFYMVLTWGGYIFVINMIGIHALILLLSGRFNTGVHKAYTLFFVIGTFLACQIPVVGWQPLRSLEQIVPLLVFLIFQVVAFCDMVRRRWKMSTDKFVSFRVTAFLFFGVALLAAVIVLYPSGYFGPLSARIRGLFVRHTKTGNPLVDSVAEHRPASRGIYMNYLNLPLDYCFFAMFVCMYHRTNGCYFAGLYAAVATIFSAKMSRLVLICAPICSIGCGVFFGFVFDTMFEPIWLILGKEPWSPKEPIKLKDSKGKGKGKGTDGKGDNGGKAAPLAGQVQWMPLEEHEEEHRPGGMMELKTQRKQEMWEGLDEDTRKIYIETRMYIDRSAKGICCRFSLTLVMCLWLVMLVPSVSTFVNHCHSVAVQLSNPRVVYWAKEPNSGERILMDDYLKGYQWIAENTPEDARVMAWWDYGYQITGIANRTSIADGNTWNHEHIATLGKTLTSSEKKAHNAIRHIADYVLVWAGGGGDDLAKSPHLARIGNSVFPDHCGDDDPKCTKFSFGPDKVPTPMMAKSLLYKAVMHNVVEGVSLDETLFQEVHTTKYGKLRVFKVLNVSQESKAWIADHRNRVCDAPGSWYCVGQYPPALDKLIEKRRSFAQIEDFNKGGQASAYTKLIEKERSGQKEL